MNNWKSCKNCIKESTCLTVEKFKTVDKCCICWHPLRCRCGGALSEIRYDTKNKPYRHCYSCHFDFYIEE